MNVIDVKNEILKMPQFKDFNWNEAKDTNVFATMGVDTKTFKDSGKNEYRLGGNLNLFISHMYKGQEGKEFFYLIVNRPSKMRNFRKHNFHGVDWNKIVVSGKTVKAIVNDLKETFENGYDIKL